jgi:cation diffusion facilitator family transporter
LAEAEARRTRQVRLVLWTILGLNIAVALAKIIYGQMTRSVSMTADGYHSLSDGSSNIIGLVGIWLASRPIDRDHPYGHQKFETFTTIGIAALLLFVVVEVISGVIARIQHPAVTQVTAASFGVMLATLAVNLFVYRYEVSKGRQLNSDFLVADALHTRSDILVSLSVLGGLVGVRMCLPWLDLVLALLVAVLIGKSAWEIITNSAQVLCDAAVVDPKLVCRLVNDVDGVVNCHHVRSRGRSDLVYLDLHVEVAPTTTVAEAHDLSHRIEEHVKRQMPAVVDVMVHVEPLGSSREGEALATLMD